MQSPSGIPLAVLVAALLVGHAPDNAHAADLDTLERGLVRQAPALIRHFKKNGYRNVGVLKFLVARQGTKGFSDNVGTLNITLARRLEVALVLANDSKAPVGIIRNASAVAARTQGASHRTVAGRKKLFEADYPLAWGKLEVKADAFITGAAEVSKDLRKLTVSLFAFDKAENKLAQIGEDFVVSNDAGKMAEINESFVLRGLFENGEAITVAAKIKEKTVKHPLRQKELPARLEILYDDEAVPVEYRDGRAFAPEPKEGQKVAFRVIRDGGKRRLGVVLKINGENSIEKQRRPDLNCRRWILSPEYKEVTITGYQIDNNTLEKFRVLSRAESKAREMNYGEQVGTVSMTVFRERKGEEVYDPPEDTDEERARVRAQVVAKAQLPEKKETYTAMKSELLKEANDDEVRGLVAGGKKVDSKIQVVKFKPDPTPVMSVTIIYYRPRATP